MGVYTAPKVRKKLRNVHLDDIAGRVISEGNYENVVATNSNINSAAIQFL